MTEEKKSKKWLWISLVIFGVIFVIFLLIVFTGRIAGESNSSPPKGKYVCSEEFKYLQCVYERNSACMFDRDCENFCDNLCEDKGGTAQLWAGYPAYAIFGGNSDGFVCSCTCNYC